nr:hypothetical protein VITISV_031739 [Ipomoea batatas]
MPVVRRRWSDGAPNAQKFGELNSYGQSRAPQEFIYSREIGSSSGKRIFICFEASAQDCEYALRKDEGLDQQDHRRAMIYEIVKAVHMMGITSYNGMEDLELTAASVLELTGYHKMSSHCDCSILTVSKGIREYGRAMIIALARVAESNEDFVGHMVANVGTVGLRVMWRVRVAQRVGRGGRVQVLRRWHARDNRLPLGYSIDGDYAVVGGGCDVGNSCCGEWWLRRFLELGPVMAVRRHGGALQRWQQRLRPGIIGILRKLAGRNHDGRRRRRLGIPCMHFPCSSYVGLVHHGEVVVIITVIAAVVLDDQELRLIVMGIVMRMRIPIINVNINVNVRRNGISGGLGAAIGEVVEDDVELGLALLDLALELPDNPVTTADGINGSHVGFIDNGPHGLVFLRRGEVADDFGNVANTEKLVGVEELALAVVGEIRGEYAIGGALSALVLASGAGLGTVGRRRKEELQTKR